MRPEKKSTVEQIKRKLEKSRMLILAEHTGLSSNQMNELRTRLKKTGSEYMVVKNRLLKRALDEKMAGLLDPMLAGPTGIVFTEGDCAKISRVVVDFAKKNEAPRVKAGYLDGMLLSAVQVGVLASLPSREVLIATFLGGMKGPISSFVRCMGELLRRFVYVCDQVAKKSGAGT